jgi:preprotein translocase subunit SecE
MALKLVETSRVAKFDWIKWLSAILLFIAGIVINFHYNSQPWPLRLLAWLFLLAVILIIVLQTYRGRQALDFARESRMELRKVFWPTRQETIQTTLVVAAMVVVLALLLWGIDGVLMWLVGWLTGQRG